MVQRIPKFFSSFWPRQLKYQLAFVFVLITTSALLTFTYHVTEKQAETITGELELQSRALAENLATASASYLIVRDYTAIEGLLMEAVKFPSIISIEVSDSSGQLIGDIGYNSDGTIEPRYGNPPLQLPAHAAPAIESHTNQVVVWQPIVLAETVGWVRITYSLDKIELATRHIWRNNIVASIIIIGIAFLLLIQMLKRPTLSLERYTDFADRLEEKELPPLEIDNSAIEFKRLGSALNRTSQRLIQQSATINTILVELKRVAALAEHSPNIVFSMNQNGEIVYLNQRANQFINEFHLQRPGLKKILPKEFEEIQQRCLDEGTVVSDIEATFAGRTFLCTFSPFSDLGVLHCYAIEITNRKKAEEALIHQANHDALTGLPNRMLAMDRLEQAINRAHRENGMVAVMFIDLDHFKKINDTAGHISGDSLLLDVAKRLQLCVREGDTVARLGGDEFIIILDNVEDIVAIEKAAERIIVMMAAPFIINGNEFFTGASIGISIYPNDDTDPHALLRNADSAMYQIKAEGRNDFAFFTAELNEQIKLRVKMENALRHAIANNELTLVYQPQIDSRSGRLIGAEALLRWNNPELGQVSPDVFIPLAEDTSLITEIGQWVMRQACSDLKSWRKKSGSDLRLAINISSRQFYFDNLPEIVQRTLDQFAIPPHLIELEITESVLIDDSHNILSILDRIKRTGVSLSLDDFGTGYSSLSYLKRFPFDSLKIDRSFVRDITTDPDDAALCEAIIAIGKTLGMSIIAEGVETLDQLVFLRGHDVEILQGYFFNRPVIASEFLEYVTSFNSVAAPLLPTSHHPALMQGKIRD